MARSISKRNTVNAQTANTSGKPPPGDKSFEIEPDICFYALEDGDHTEEGEDGETLTTQDKRLTETKQNIFKRNSPYINTFDQH